MNKSRAKQYRKEYIEIFGKDPTQFEWRKWKRLRKNIRKPTLSKVNIGFYKSTFETMAKQREEIQAEKEKGSFQKAVDEGSIKIMEPSWWDKFKRWLKKKFSK